MGEKPKRRSAAASLMLIPAVSNKTCPPQALDYKGSNGVRFQHNRASRPHYFRVTALMAEKDQAHHCTGLLTFQTCRAEINSANCAESAISVQFYPLPEHFCRHLRRSHGRYPQTRHPGPHHRRLAADRRSSSRSGYAAAPVPAVWCDSVPPVLRRRCRKSARHGRSYCRCALMFSTIPRTGTFTFLNMAIPFIASPARYPAVVVTTTHR